MNVTERPESASISVPMIRNLRRVRKLWLINGALVLTASAIGATQPSIYDGLLMENGLPATISQDILAFALSIINIVIALRMHEEDWKQQLGVLGIFGFYFYAYGIYVIERIYTSVYLLYLAILGISFWNIVYSTLKIRKEYFEKVQLSKGFRRLSAGFLLLNPIIFYPLWISQILPVLGTGTKLEFYYSIYIIDLCFTFPAIIIAAALLLQDNGVGKMLTPALGIVAAGILSPLWIGELVKLLYFGGELYVGEAVLYLVLSAAFSAITLLQLKKLQITNIALTRG